MDLIGFGGEVWLWVPYPVWIIGGFLALNCGWLVGIALVDFVRKALALGASLWYKESVWRRVDRSCHGLGPSRTGIR